MHASRLRRVRSFSVRTNGPKPIGWLFGATLATFFFFAAAGTASARQGDPPESRVQPVQALGSIAVRTLPSVDVGARLAEDLEAPPGPQRFAIPEEINVTPSTAGTWEQLSDGGRLWRLRFHSPGATDLNFGFTRFWLPRGATLHVVSEGVDYFEGPYTHRDNKSHRQLWTPVVPGDRAVIELYLPAGTTAKPDLVLARVGKGYRDMFGPGFGDGNGGDPEDHGECNNDVICPLGDPWRDEIRSVGMYSIEGVESCSGTLIKDVPGSFKPFFLTANHCELTTDNAATVVVYWHYESATCGAQTCTLGANQTGSTLRAARADVDFALLELDDDPTPHGVYYAGWDRSGIAAKKSVGIHHPRTHCKSISLNNDLLTTVDSCIGAGTATHWRVDDWEDGTTEPGSSGSGLWSVTTHKLIGFLSGGAAECPDDNGDDCYGKFSVAWNGANASVRLRDWLDPDNTGTMKVWGMEPPAVPAVSAWGAIGAVVLMLAVSLALAVWSRRPTAR